jgi:pyrophosphatase PpaX
VGGFLLAVKYDCVLFDLDGTLLNSNNLIIESFKHTLITHLNLQVEEKELYQYFGEPLRTTLARYDAENLESLLHTYRMHYADNHDRLATVFPRVQEVVNELHNHKIIMGVVTSKLRAGALKGIELTGIAGYMKTIVAYEDTEHHKPDPAPVLTALSALNHSGEKALFVGDSPFDWLCAKNAGITSVGVSWSVHLGNNSLEVNPDYVINNFKELISICLDDEVDCG